MANTSTHKTKIYVGGKLNYTWPISTGKTVTPDTERHLPDGREGQPGADDRRRPKGTAGYYNELVNYAVRFTFSGDYYHSAPWSVVNQGVTNVSHGCVNLAPEDAKIYYDMAIPGDPITITSSTKAGKWDNGWTEWFLSWSQYLARAAPPTWPSRPARAAARSSARQPARQPRHVAARHLEHGQLLRGLSSDSGMRAAGPALLGDVRPGAPAETARITPSVSARASGISSGAAARAVRRRLARRLAPAGPVAVARPRSASRWLLRLVTRAEASVTPLLNSYRVDSKICPAAHRR